MAKKRTARETDTRSYREQYVKDAFQELADLTEEKTGLSERAMLSGPQAVRRQKALLSVMDRAETEFGMLGPVEELLTDAELRPLLTYNSINENEDLTLGAALWILDTIRKSGRMMELMRILPDPEEVDEDDLIPIGFSYPCFSDDMIRAVMYMLIYRRATWQDVTSDEAARGEKTSDRFRQMMDLLPEAEVRKACDTFCEKQWDLLTRFVRSLAIVQKELDRNGEEQERLLDEEDSGFIPGYGPVSMLAAKPFSTLISGQLMPNNTSPEVDRLEAEERQLLEFRSLLFLRFSDVLQMERRQITRRCRIRQIADVLGGFDVVDPYEICFAVYTLIESGKDEPWLVAAGSHLCQFAQRMLPWYVDMSKWEDDDWEKWFDGPTYNVDGWLERESPEEQVDYYHTKHQGKNLAQIIYELSRTVVPTGKHPFEKKRQELIAEGLDEAAARKVTETAELFFLREFQVDQTPYYASDIMDTEKEEAGEDTKQEEPPPSLGGYWGSVLGMQQPQEKAPEAPSAQETEDLSEELSRAKKEIKALKETLSRERREMKNDRLKLERELKTLRMEHRELADLRELVFNQQQEKQEEIEKPEKKIQYPYETRKRTVIFGGHDSFLRAIRPMLPNARFVDAENMTYSPDIIRNADVVWIQNNCISHPQYWSIVKNCKLSGVQMRYFAFASAEKCAEQVAEWDMKT